MKQYLTEQGYQDLEQELEQRKAKRDDIVADIQEARSQGDLSENADYEAARDQQAENEQRIKVIENILKDAEIIEANGEDIVALGKTVTVMVNDKQYTVTIVGTLEADPFNGKISNECPVARAIMGQKPGFSTTTRSESGKQLNISVSSIR